MTILFVVPGQLFEIVMFCCFGQKLHDKVKTNASREIFQFLPRCEFIVLYLELRTSRCLLCNTVGRHESPRKEIDTDRPSSGSKTSFLEGRTSKDTHARFSQSGLYIKKKYIKYVLTHKKFINLYDFRYFRRPILFTQF